MVRSTMARNSMIAGETEAYWKRLFATLLAAAPGQQAALPIVCYPGHSAAFNRYVDRFQREAYAEGLRCIGSIRNRRVLDIGCGIGRWLRMLTAEGACVTGVDVSPDAVEFCRRYVPEAQVICSPLADFTWAGEPFDVLSSVTVLQHVPWNDQEPVLRRIAEHVKPGGYGVFLELVRTGDERREYYEGTGSFANTPGEWSEMFAEAGFRVAHQKPVLFFPMVNNVHLPLKRAAGRALRAAGLRRRGVPSGNPVSPSSASPLATVEARVDYWFLAATAPLSNVLERVLTRCPEQRLAAFGIAGSHRLFVTRREGS